MKKKVLALCLVVVLAATAVIGGTLAYFTDSKEATNTFTVGNVKIDLTEKAWDEVGSVDAEDVYAYEALKKDPVVTNTGKNPCFVRISVTGWDCLIKAGLSEELVSYETNYVKGDLGEKWAEGTDGYFYYVGVLDSGKMTSALFDQIRIPADLENDAEAPVDEAFNIVVKAEAVQAQGARASWTEVQNMDAAAIQAWFETVMAG